MIRPLALALACCLGLAAGEIGYGHPDFYPTAERPLTWRADGTGCYLGATPPTSFDSEAKRNLVWKSDMPAPSYCVPIVVGEKVFTMADPNILVCVNVHDGKILWQTEVDHTLDMKPADRKRARQLHADYETLFLRYGMWRERLKPVLRSMEQGGVDLKAKRVFFGKKANLQKPEGRKDFDAWRAKHPDLAKEFDALYEEGKQDRFCTGNSGNAVQIQYLFHDTWKGLAEEGVSKYDLQMFSNWYGFVCKTYPAPCTDGELLYVQTVNHAFAAVDLHGEVKWLKWHHPDRSKYENKDPRFMTRFVKSPVLLGDYLVARGDSLLRCLDKKTGKLLWEHCTSQKQGKSGKPKLGCRPSPEAGQHTVGHLTLPDGGKLPVVIDPMGTVHRLSDGHVLCKVPQSQNGVFMLRDDVYYGITGASDRGKSIGGEMPLPGGFAFRLTLTSKDKAEAKQRHPHPGGRRVAGQVAVPRYHVHHRPRPQRQGQPPVHAHLGAPVVLRGSVEEVPRA